jgi:pimeloyl-ACP methyl ester carboxylesterase
MAPKHRIYLLPGFFGFTYFGGTSPERIVYFHHVCELLNRRLGGEAEVVALTSHPTGTLEQRGEDLLALMKPTATLDDAAIHLVGHSTGGLDARRLVSPAMAGQVPDFIRRVRSVVSLATPHYGTPLATFFHESGLGELALKLLYVATAFALHEELRSFTTLVFRTLYEVSRAGARVGYEDTLLDKLVWLLSKDMPPEERETLRVFLQKIGGNQALIQQLTPRGMDVFNRDMPDSGTVRYGSVVTGAPPPSPSGWEKAVFDPEKAASPLGQLKQLLDGDVHAVYGAYWFLYEKTDPQASELHAPVPTAAQAELLSAGISPDFLNWSDGIVPTRSQVWGELLHAVRADHLDVVGHFDEPEKKHWSWLKSGSDFHTPEFERMWDRVIAFMLRP